MEKMEQEQLARDDKLRRLVEALETRDRLVDTKISDLAGELEGARCKCSKDKENRPPTSSSSGVSLFLIGSRLITNPFARRRTCLSRVPLK